MEWREAFYSWGKFLFLQYKSLGLRNKVSKSTMLASCNWQPDWMHSCCAIRQPWPILHSCKRVDEYQSIAGAFSNHLQEWQWTHKKANPQDADQCSPQARTHYQAAEFKAWRSLTHFCQGIPLTGWENLQHLVLNVCRQNLVPRFGLIAHVGLGQQCWTDFSESKVQLHLSLSMARATKDF